MTMVRWLLALALSAGVAVTMAHQHVPTISVSKTPIDTSVSDNWNKQRALRKAAGFPFTGYTSSGSGNTLTVTKDGVAFTITVDVE